MRKVGKINSKVIFNNSKPHSKHSQSFQTKEASIESAELKVDFKKEETGD